MKKRLSIFFVAALILGFLPYSLFGADTITQSASLVEVAKRSVLKVDTIATASEGGSEYNLQELDSMDLGIEPYGATGLGFELAVQVLGYYLDENGDPDGVFEGNGIFKLVHDDSLTANGGTVLAASYTLDSSRGADDAFWSLVSTGATSSNVMYFGATGDGVTDDRESIQAALDSGLRTIYFPSGTFQLTSPGEDDTADYAILNIPGDTRIVMSPGTLIRLTSTATGRYKILNIEDVDNVHIDGNGALIQGDRVGPAASSFNHGHGVNIEGSDNVSIVNLTSRDNWGDGFYVGSGSQGFSSNVEFRGCFADNNRRQGLSVVSAKKFHDYGSSYDNTNGATPSAGVDLEPDSATEFLEDIRFFGTRANGNDGSGFFVFLGNFQAADRTLDVEFIGCRTEGSSADAANVGGQYAAYEVRRVVDVGGADIPDGSIKFIDCFSVDDEFSGFAVTDKSSLGPRVQIVRPTVINPNQSASTAGPSQSVGIRVHAANNSFTESLGGVDVIGPFIVDRDGNLDDASLAAIFFGDASGAPLTDVHLYNPRIALSSGSAAPFYQANNNGGVWFSQNSNAPEFAYTASSTILSRRIGYVVTNEGQIGGTVTMTLGANSQIGVGAEVEFLVKESQLFRIDPNASEEIVPLGSGLGKYAESSTIGSRLRLRRESSTQWSVVSVVGSWTWEP